MNGLHTAFSINDEDADNHDEISRRIGGSSISSESTVFDRNQIKIVQNGGDASQLHLISLIDAGISKRRRQKPGERAVYYHKIYKVCEPFKFIAIIIYILITQFEQPAFCLRIKKEKELKPQGKYSAFDSSICNDVENNYTNFHYFPKLHPAITRPLEISCLLLLLAI